MAYLVTATVPAGSNAGRTTPQHSIFDTEELAKAQAENWLKMQFKEVSIWKQISTPRIEQTIIWETGNAIEA